MKVGVEGNSIRKFRESNAKGFYYAVSWVMCVYVMSLENYWPNIRNVWEHMTPEGDISSQPCPVMLQAFYIWELSWYVGSSFTHIFLDEKLKDFYILLLHHAITIGLIMFSYMVGYHRIGVLVLFCHDFSDVFLEYTKVFLYIKKVDSTLLLIDLRAE